MKNIRLKLVVSEYPQLSTTRYSCVFCLLLFPFFLLFPLRPAAAPACSPFFLLFNFYTHIFLYYLLSRGDTSPPPPTFLLPSPLPPDGSACIHEHTGVAQHSGGGFQSPAPVDCSTTTSSTSGSDRTSARILIAQFFSSFEQFNLEVSPKRVP